MLVGVVLALSSMRLKSVTYDETSHLTAGYSYLRTGDFRLTPDHPPLAEVMAGAALFTLDLKEPQWDGPAWDHGVVWKIGRDFLNRPNDVGAMLYRGRLMIVALWIVGGFLVCLWSRRQFGAAGGLISAAVYSLSPNLLAHARLVTTDIAAGVFFVGTLLGSASCWSGYRLHGSVFRRSFWRVCFSRSSPPC